MEARELSISVSTKTPPWPMSTAASHVFSNECSGPMIPGQTLSKHVHSLLPTESERLLTCHILM